MATAAPPGKSVHLYRLLTLTIDQGNIVVSTIFDQAIGNVPLHQFLTQEKKTIKRLRSNKVITKVQYDKLFPQAGNPPPTTADFDLTLAVCLLRNLNACGLNPNFNWNAPPQPGDTSLEADLRRLQMFRNALAHISSTRGINQVDFNQKWIDTEQVLNRLNSSLRPLIPNLQQNIDDCKTKLLDHEAQEHIDKHIESMQSSLVEIENKMQDLRVDVTDISQRMDVFEEEKKSEKTRESTINKAQLVQAKEDEYQETKKQLKEDLAAFHRHKHSTIPLSPLFEEKDTPLVDFYLMPGMEVVKMEHGEEEKTAIQSLSEVYKSEDNFSKEIYVTADAGFGKTAFSKYLTVLWRQAHFPDEKHTKHLKEESVNVMREFEFLFLVLLRESSDDCSIDDLIMNQVVKNVSRSTLYNKHFLQEVLNRERCLVVLDGLDEWTHSDTKCGNKDKSIPHRSARENCTIMTTTRPWKLSTLQLSTSQNDKKIKLTNLDSHSALELTTRALKKSKGKREVEENESDQEELQNEAEKLITSYSDFEQVSVPLLLMYVICLWCEDIPVEQTKCGLYASIIELLLSRTVSKYKKFSQSDLPQCSKNVPKCFRKKKHCKAYYSFLTSLGKLAFQTLFSKTSENRLVFDSSIAAKCLKDEFLELGLLTGIITQDKQSKLLSQIRKTSFSHKTVQEFFAALYISTCSNQDKVLTQILSFCNSVQDILDLSKVFLFISGFNINTKLIPLLSSEFMKVINKDEETRQFRSSIDSFMYPLKYIQDMFVSCIEEMPDNKTIKICLQDFFFEYKCKQGNYYTILQRIARQNKINIKSIDINLMDFEVMRCLYKIIDDCEFTDPRIHCQKLYCIGCEEQEVIRLLSPSVKCLDLNQIQTYHQKRDSLTYLTRQQRKTFHKTSQLETVQFANTSLNSEVVNYILNIKSIKKLKMNMFRIIEGEDIDLSQQSELRTLDLYRGDYKFWDMDEDERSMSRKMRNIKYVSLSYITLPRLFFYRFVKIIEKLEHSVKVELDHCSVSRDEEEEFIDIEEYVRGSERFVVE